MSDLKECPFCKKFASIYCFPENDVPCSCFGSKTTSTINEPCIPYIPFKNINIFNAEPFYKTNPLPNHFYSNKN